MSQRIRETLRRAISLLEETGVDYMVIGGYALPFYGAIRTTINIDIAVAIKDETQFDRFLFAAKERGYEPQICSFLNPECVLLDNRTGLEIEFWMRIDGVEWNRETLKRRRRYNLDSLEVWVISPEDFIVNKLARPDRTAQDEKDVKSVLVRLRNELDRKYLEERAKKAGVLSMLRVIDENKDIFQI